MRKMKSKRGYCILALLMVFVLAVSAIDLTVLAAYAAPGQAAEKTDAEGTQMEQADAGQGDSGQEPGKEKEQNIDEKQTVISWEWEKDADGKTPVSKDSKRGVWYFTLSADENDVSTKITRDFVRQIVETFGITVTLADKTEKLLYLTWDLNAIPEDGTYSGDYTLKASLASGYELAEDEISVILKLENQAKSAAETSGATGGEEPGDPKYPGTRTLFSNTAELDAALASHTVQAVEPDNVNVNLFDYGVNHYVSQGGKWSDLLSKNNQRTSGINGADENSWNFGINANHLLTFGDSMIHAGFWNLGAGAGRPWGKRNTNMKDIVEKSLGADGYPVVNMEEGLKDQSGIGLQRDDDIWGINVAEKDNGTRAAGTNLSTGILRRAGGMEKADGAWDTDGIDASLKYLFDPGETNDFKSVYKNVKGLFQLDDEGYYYYYARKNFAELDTSQASGDSDGRFKLYDGPAMWRTDGGYTQTGGECGTASETGNFDGANSLGNFYPFNTARQVFDSVDENGRLSSTKKLSNNGDTNWDNVSNDFINKAGPDGTTNSIARDMKTNQVTGEPFYINHHLGMTVDMTFRQPVGGVVKSGAAGEKPMTFQFSGDDDVWVFIDDVLVLDIGGIHSELYGTINFETGDVLVGQSWRTGGEFPSDAENADGYPGVTDKTTIKKCFEDAGKDIRAVDWKGNTFASNTTHEIKMFYLERGNYDSSLALKFNLQPLLPQEVKKVDQNGNPLGNVEFTMYPAELADADDPAALRCANVVGSNNEAAYIKKVDKSAALANLKTDTATGRAQFVRNDGTGDLYNFADNYQSAAYGRFYILEETRTPDGYRSLPIPIVLEFNPKTTMLSVANRWQTGAYASFNSYVTGNSKLSYAQFNPDTTELEATTSIVDRTQQEDGLVFALPMIYQKSTKKWIASYGDNTKGFHTKTPENRTAEAWREAALAAILHQCADADSPSWYLEWNDDEHRLRGILSDLPGRADHYLLQNDDGDMRMVYAIITKEGLAKLGITGGTSTEKYEKLRQHILAKGSGDAAVDATVAELKLTGDIGVREFSFLNVDEFNRDFRSLIYIPNEQRELRVQKVDQDGNAVNGAEFALFDTQDREVARGTTASITNENGVQQDGMLIFTPKPEMDSDTKTKAGYAKMEWVASDGGNRDVEYYLREVKAPAGHEVNNTKIPVIVGIYSIYADAGKKDDGVTVMAGVGKLAQTMTKYANDETVNITLRDITATGQTQKSGAFSLDGWQDMKLAGTEIKRKMNLHYGENAVVDYGLHDQDGGKNLDPFFVTDVGFIRARVEQNYAALEKDIYHNNVNNDANKDNLGGTDITSLFSLLNIVVVTDKTADATDTGQLTIRKTVAGPSLADVDYTRNFDFTVTFTGTGDKEFYFYGTDKSGSVKSGDTIPLHHDESITILGLPVGTDYSVTEAQDTAFTALPGATIAGSIVAKDDVEIAHFTNTKERIVPPDLTPGLSIEKEQSLNDGKRTKKLLSAKAGDTVTYYLTIRNGAKASAKDVTVTDAVPSGLVLVNGSISDQGVETGGIISWQLGDLGAGKQKTVSYKVTVPQVTKYTKWRNVAAVRYSNNPAGPGRDISSNEVSVENDPDARAVPTGDLAKYGIWLVLALSALLVGIFIKRSSLLRGRKG